MKLEFEVFALYPVHSKQANQFLACLDLGIEGAYIPKAEVWTISFKEGIEPDIEKTISNIKYILETDLGCKDIYVNLVKEKEE